MAGGGTSTGQHPSRRRAAACAATPEGAKFRLQKSRRNFAGGKAFAYPDGGCYARCANETATVSPLASASRDSVKIHTLASSPSSFASMPGKLAAVLSGLRPGGGAR